MCVVLVRDAAFSAGRRGWRSQKCTKIESLLGVRLDPGAFARSHPACLVGNAPMHVRLMRAVGDWLQWEYEVRGSRGTSDNGRKSLRITHLACPTTSAQRSGRANARRDPADHGCPSRAPVEGCPGDSVRCGARGGKGLTRRGDEVFSYFLRFRKNQKIGPDAADCRLASELGRIESTPAAASNLRWSVRAVPPPTPPCPALPPPRRETRLFLAFFSRPRALAWSLLQSPLYRRAVSAGQLRDRYPT